MARKKHSPEQVVRKLADADKLLEQGLKVPEVCRRLEVAEPTYYAWRKRYQGMSVDEARELRELRDENARSKRCEKPNVSRNASLVRSSGNQDRRNDTNASQILLMIPMLSCGSGCVTMPARTRGRVTDAPGRVCVTTKACGSTGRRFGGCGAKKTCR